MAYQYIAKTTLEEDVETYVKRDADEQLYQGLIQGEICNVFNSRKIGKSSLAIRTIKRLREANVQSVVIDFSLDDTRLEHPEQWYASMLDILAFELTLDVDIKKWNEERNWLTRLRKFRQFIETVLLTQISDNIVIFLDEIDSVISLNLPTDDFFAFIRGCYNLRATKPEYKRLTFCLLGVVTVSDLIQDKRRTPFNIGQAIELKGFTLEEAAPVLTKGLEGKFGNNATEILKQIIDKTGGQPFLTQKLCQRVLEYAETDNPNIDKIVQTYIIDNWEAQDNPELLRTIRNRLISQQVQNRTSRLLGIYQQILTNGQITADNSPDQMELQLSGLVVKENGHLRVYNPIYQQIFNLQWIQQELAKLRPYQENFQAWIESNRQDDSRLLRGQALDEALNWKKDKRLSDDDTTFLDASQRDEIEYLRQAKAKAKALIKTAQEGTRIEMAGLQALRRFDTETEQLQALRDAKNLGKDLQKLLKTWNKLVEDEPELAAESPATSPFLALQTILSKIRELHTFRGHTNSLRSVSLSADGKYLATGSNDCTAKLWSTETQSELHTFRGHSDKVTSVSLSADGKYLATGSDDDTAKLWSTETQSALHTFRGHGESVWSVSLSADGKYLATGSNDCTAKLWSTETKQALHTFTGHTGWITSVSLSADGKYLATGSDDCTAKLWSTETQSELHTFTGHTVSLSADGKYLATGSADDTAKLWSTETKEELHTFTGHTHLVWSVSLSSDGKYLATGSYDNTAKLWSTETQKLLHTFTGHSNRVTSVSLSADGKYLATGSGDKTAKLWSTATQSALHTFIGHTHWVLSVSWSADGKYLATGSSDNTAKLWSTETTVHTFTDHTDWVTSVSLSADGKYLATGSSDNTAKLWSTETTAEIYIFTGHTNWVRSVSLSDDGKYLATGSADKTAKLWSTETQAEIHSFTGHTDSVRSVSLSADGKYLATGSADNTAKLWSTETTAEIYTFTGHTNWVTSVSLSADGKYLATGSADKTAKLWSTETQAEIHSFTGHTDSVRSVSLSADGKYLATGSADNTVKLWDLSGNLIADFVGYQDRWQFIEIKSSVLSVCFSPDSKYLAAGYSDGTVRLWRVESLDELLGRAKAWLGES